MPGTSRAERQLRQMLQSLTLANDRAFQEIARGLATRVIEHLPEGTDEARVRYAVELCLARDPSATELVRLGEFVRVQQASFDADHAAAAAALGASAESRTIPRCTASPIPTAAASPPPAQEAATGAARTAT